MRPLGHLIQRDALPKAFPTHRHTPEFWEALGRAVATFGFLEEMLGKAIFALTATTHHAGAEAEKAYVAWQSKLERALMDPLGSLTTEYEKAFRNHQSANVENLAALVAQLRLAAELRNVICHGSWRPPDSNGSTVPFFANKRRETFQTPINVSFLIQLQQSTADLACTVMDSVTHMGFQFPGSNGPGGAIWHAR